MREKSATLGERKCPSNGTFPIASNGPRTSAIGIETQETLSSRVSSNPHLETRAHFPA
jgi:hypothetical protein